MCSLQKYLILASIAMLASCTSAPQPTSQPSPTSLKPEMIAATQTASPTIAPSATSTPSATITPTSTQLPAETRRPTETPRPTSAPPRSQIGTLAPQPVAVISADNADQVVELARWGKGTIQQVVYSANGQIIAIASSLGVYLHDTRSLQEIAYFQTDSFVNRISISSDGQTIAGLIGINCRCDQVVRLWSRDDGSSHTLQQVLRGARDIYFSDDGESLIVDAEDGRSLWRVSDGSFLNILDDDKRPTLKLERQEGDRSEAAAVAKLISSDGTVLNKIEIPPQDFYIYDGLEKWQLSEDNRLIVGMTIEEGVMLFWYLDEERVRLVDGFGYGDFSLSPDGSRVAAGYDDGWVRLDRTSDGQLINTLKGHDIDEVKTVFSPDSSTLLTYSQDGVIRLWRASDGALLQSLPGHVYPSPSSQAANITFAGNLVASAGGRLIQIRRISDGGLLRAFEIPVIGDHIRGFEAPSGVIEALSFTPDGNVLAAGTDDGFILFWRVSDGALINTLDNECPVWNHIAFSPDGQAFVAQGYWLGCLTVRLWRLSDEMVLFTKDSDEFALSPDGKIVAVLDVAFVRHPNSQIEIRETNNGSLLTTLNFQQTYVSNLVFSPEQYILAATTETGMIFLWRLSDGTLLHKLLGQAGLHSKLAFSPDGQLLASASVDDKTRLWDVTSGELILMLEPNLGEVITLAFSPDGALLATADGDNTVRLWDVRKGTLLHVLYGHNADIVKLAFVSDKLLLTGSYDGTIRLWGIAP